jgi:hypothetical protein
MDMLPYIRIIIKNPYNMKDPVKAFIIFVICILALVVVGSAIGM